MHPNEPPDLRSYASALAQRDAAAGPESASPLRQLARRYLSRRTRHGMQRTLTRLLSPWAIRRARRLARVGPLRLNLACGTSPLAGWINVDLVGGRADLPWCLDRPLPFPDASCEAVHAEHFIEHLPLAAAIGFAAEARRLLQPGGTVRLGVPDFGRYAASYLGKNDLIQRYRPGRPTPLLALAEIAYLHGHRTLWDEETLIALLTEAGFNQAIAMGFGESAIRPAPDSAHRRVETLYVEATG